MAGAERSNFNRIVEIRKGEFNNRAATTMAPSAQWYATKCTSPTWYDSCVEEDRNAAVKMLTGQGHTVRKHIRYGVLWFEIDGKMVATRQEMLELADGVYSLSELSELFERRRAEEQSRP